MTSTEQHRKDIDQIDPQHPPLIIPPGYKPPTLASIFVKNYLIPFLVCCLFSALALTTLYIIIYFGTHFLLLF